MNVDQYMDDLFGEADNVSHHIAATAPAVKGLPLRLDALASSNCCRSVSNLMSCGVNRILWD